MRTLLKNDKCQPENYIGNRLERSLDLIGPDKKTLREKYYVGEPRDCAAGSAAEMKHRGYVGIYEKQSRPRLAFPKLNFLLTKATADW